MVGTSTGGSAGSATRAAAPGAGSADAASADAAGIAGRGASASAGEPMAVAISAAARAASCARAVNWRDGPVASAIVGGGSWPGSSKSGVASGG